MSKKILIIGPAWIGDMVMAQILFKLLKGSKPDHLIDVVAPDWSLPLLARMPEVSQAISLPIPHGKLGLGVRYRLAKTLRQENYEQAIVLTNSFKSALVPFLAKIPKRTGWLGEFRFGLLNDIRYLDKEKLPLMIQRFMALGLSNDLFSVDKSFYPHLQISPDLAQQTLDKYSLNPKQALVLALCPGAEFGPAKRWPETHYAEIAKEKLSQGWQVWIFGSAKDSHVAAKIQALTGNACVDLTGKTSLAEAIDLLSMVDAVISNDSGLMHIAAALKRLMVVLYGSSSPQFTPPLTEKVKIISLGLPCSPCFKRECPYGHLQCLKNLKPASVSEALDELYRSN